MPDKNHSGGHFEMDMMMSQKEAKRGQVMELLSAGKVTQKEASKMLAVSVRQIKRILRRYSQCFNYRARGQFQSKGPEQGVSRARGQIPS